MDEADRDADATIVARAAPPGLRDAVLAGRYFRAAARDHAAALAAFLAAPLADAASWFGAAIAARLRRDADAMRGALDRDIAAIDALIGRQLDAILHAARLRRLEGSWRGLAWLLDGIDPASRIKVRLLPAGWGEIARDLERAAEFDQSNLFRRIYEDEFGTPGGEPYGLLLVDHDVRHRPAPGSPADDPAVVMQLAAVAAAAFAPTVLGASPALLDADAWSDLAMTPEPASSIQDAAHMRWRRLGQFEDMRFIGVAAPRLLARLPWTDDPARRTGFRYTEYAPDAGARVWMSAGYAFAATVTRAFAAYGWPADLRGIDADREGGGVVTELPAEGYSTEREKLWPRPPLELVFNDRQERSLVNAGFMPLSGLPFTDDAAFVALRSLQVPANFAGEAGQAASANARLSAQFNSMLCVSRFAHYVKVMGRDMAGSFKTGDEIQRRLQDWLARYVNANVVTGPEGRARAPLLAGQVSVRENPGKPGSFGCTIFLQPHFQLDDVSATFRLTTDLNAPGRAA
jgi:type VI secretion system protein ImpD/type VI secretion system protein ImpC